ncbi:MAG: PHP domain-containing protein [Lachnospiraceae bacterium]|nr:PHP domain-containing protein [Lachnospiraceae bacterium]
MSFVDLHVHTTASDGTLTPAEVVLYGAKKGLSAIAITDHDTIDGIEEAITKAEELPIEAIPGVELACIYEGVEIHILGLFLNWKESMLKNHLQEMRERRIDRNQKMIERMNQDQIPVTMEALQFGEKDTVITRAHFARYLQQEGFVKTKEEAFSKYIGIGCPYYLPREYVSPKEAICWIREAEGLSFLAHPYLYGFTEIKVEKMIQYLKENGIHGLEAYHGSCSMGQTEMLRQYALKYHLLVSGGSDFHGDNKPDIDLGTGRGSLRITHYVYENLKEAHQMIFCS